MQWKYMIALSNPKALVKTDLQTTFGIDERMQSELFIILLPDTL